MGKVVCGVTFKSNRGLAQELAEAALDRGLIAVGLEAVTMTHRDRFDGGTPVDTGRLKNSIAWAVKNKAGGGGDNTGGDDASKARLPAPPKHLVIGTNVNYALYVEEGAYNVNYGFGKGVGAHMLRNAIIDGRDRWKELIEASLEAASTTDSD